MFIFWMLGLVSTKKVYHHDYFLRHVSHFGYSLPFHFLKDFRQVRDRRYLDQVGTSFGGVNVVVWRLIGLALGLGIQGFGDR